MRKISENLFIYLTKHVISNENDIEDYINKTDSMIYLTIDKDKELYFVVSGKFIIDADNEIRYDKTDKCLFVKSARTGKNKTIDARELKKCIEAVSISDYCIELKEIFHEYINLNSADVKEPSFRELIDEFSKEIEKAKLFCREVQITKEDDYISYAMRISENKDQIKRIEELFRVKRYIEAVWANTLYDTSKQSIIEQFIKRILKRVLSYNISQRRSNQRCRN